MKTIYLIFFTVCIVSISWFNLNQIKINKSVADFIESQGKLNASQHELDKRQADLNEKIVNLITGDRP